MPNALRNKTADLNVALACLVRFSARLGMAYVDFAGDLRVDSEIRRLLGQEIEAGMIGVADEPTRQIVFELADKLMEYARAKPIERTPLRAPHLPGQKRRD